MAEPVQLDFETWRERFEPIKNHFNPDRGYDGCLFETYGAEKDFIWSVVQDSPGSIWTLHDNGQIASGWHFVDRAGYFFCARPFGADEDFIVGEPEDDESDDEPAAQCRTDGCDGDPDDGDGWDGFCGNCADARANAQADEAEADHHQEGL